MDIFLVGGAVRDKLMGIPIKDNDYLVVGSTPEEMIKLGYKPIGKNFPVFLHPTTKEEYALARTERKVGKGYHGFEFCASPDVTLEEDLKRRDITINAIAMDDDGNLYDPFNGIEDIKNNCIRHVSDAFSEDPLRVLRVARFKAKYKTFKVDSSTKKLLAQIVKNNEIESLSAERILTEILKGLVEEDPIGMLDTLDECGALERIIPSVKYREHCNNFRALFENKKIKELSPEHLLVLLILISNFSGEQLDPSIKSFVKQLKVSGRLNKLVSLILDNLNDLLNFLDLENQTQLDCCYHFDFFRRPQLIFESIMMIEILYDSYQMNFEDVVNTKKLLKQFDMALDGLKINGNLPIKGSDIKKIVYQNRLELIKKLVS